MKLCEIAVLAPTSDTSTALVSFSSEKNWDLWDRQITADATSGRLNALRARALQQIQQEKAIEKSTGKVNELPT